MKRVYTSPGRDRDGRAKFPEVKEEPVAIKEVVKKKKVVSKKATPKKKTK